MPRLKKPDPLAKAIGGRVRELRLERELTAEKLAYENGISKGTISDLESGLARPSVATLKRIADGLDVELLDLFTRPSSSERHRVIDLTRGASLGSLRAAASALRERSRDPR
jgi:transcriptional regulator with XRE-family HTH domain